MFYYLNGTVALLDANLAVIDCLLRPLGKKLRIRFGDEALEGSFMLIAAGNGKVYGGGYMATPNAVVDDGIIDVVTARKISLPRILKVLGVYKKGEHITPDGEVTEALQDCLEYRRVDSLVIESDKPFCVNIDGEVLETDSVRVEMLHHSFRFVVPPAYAHPLQETH